MKVCKTCAHYKEWGDRVICTVRDVTWGWDMYPNGLCWEQGKNNARKPYKMRNPYEQEVITKMYHTHSAKEIADILGCTVWKVYQAAYNLGLAKKNAR